MLCREGVVFRNTGEDSAVVTTIASTAVNSWLHSMYCNDQPMVDENGDMNSCVVDMLVGCLKAKVFLVLFLLPISTETASDDVQCLRNGSMRLQRRIDGPEPKQ